MNTKQYESMMYGLLLSAKEKFSSMGIYALVDVDNIRKVIEDLECFYNSDGKTSSEDWEGEIDLIILDFQDTITQK